MGKPSRTDPLHLALAIAQGVIMLLASAPRSAFPQTQGTSVALQLPCAMAYDAQGNLYFSERGGHTVARLAPQGMLTTIAGTGTQGFAGDGGSATSAELDSPCGVALSTSGDLYIADTHNNRVRKLTATTGVITTIAGTGAPAFSGDAGPATSAALDAPTALAFDTAGNLYLADTGNHRIRRISAADGTIATVAGNGTEGLAGDGSPAVTASLDSPSGLAVDSAGDLLIADTHNHRVREVLAATGVITTIAGTVGGPGLPPLSGDNGPATESTLALPHGITVDPAGNIYIADTADERVREIDGATGDIHTVAGGAQSFSGDNGPAVNATLDSPRSVALSPGGLLTIADTGNARIRQVYAATGSGPNIHTIAGLGDSGIAAGLTLSGPSVVSYGSGTFAAVLAAPGATGTLTFLDTSNASPVTVAAVPLSNGTAVLNTATLAVGEHSISAVFSGDATYAAAQSSALAIRILPLTLTAAATPVSAVYGAAVPPLTGTVAGVLPQDSGKVQAVFGSSAAALSPAATYPIAVTLTGPAAANYTVGSVSGVVTISQAPTTTSMALSSPFGGALSIITLSTTAGTPTGTVTLFDGASALTSLPLTGGAAAFISTALVTGTHSLTAIYSGDRNFLGSTSPALVVSSSAPNFSLAATGASAQSVPAGSAAVFAFSMVPEGTPLASPVMLTAAGLPTGASASFSPAYLPPGQGPASFTLTVQTPPAVARSISGGDTVGWAALGGFLLAPLPFGMWRRRSARSPGLRFFFAGRAIMASAGCIVFATLATGCGARVNLGSEAQTAPTYTLTVTGTATSPSGTSIQHTAKVTLQVL